jgi:hypothetical protein
MKNSHFAGEALFIRYRTMNQKLQYANENLSIFEYNLFESSYDPLTAI